MCNCKCGIPRALITISGTAESAKILAKRWHRGVYVIRSCCECHSMHSVYENVFNSWLLQINNILENRNFQRWWGEGAKKKYLYNPCASKRKRFINGNWGEKIKNILRTLHSAGTECEYILHIFHICTHSFTYWQLYKFLCIRLALTAIRIQHSHSHSAFSVRHTDFISEMWAIVCGKVFGLCKVCA